eukprot:jgi/Tetstr1/465274/TSEL_009976.t1
MSASACGSATHRDTLMWTNIAPQPDIQNYVNNISAIKLTDPGPSAWDLCLSEFPHVTPVVTTDYFPEFVARPGSYAFRVQTNGQPGAGMAYEHDGPLSWADIGRWREPPAPLRARDMGFTSDDLPTFHLSEASPRTLLGGVVHVNVMRKYIKAVSGAATAPPIINVCHTSHGIYNPATKRETVTCDVIFDERTLVASAIAEIVRPYSVHMAALALPAPSIRVSKAPRDYQEAIPNNHPDD